MKQCFIPTKNFQELQTLCADLMQTSMGLEMGMVLGPAGRGKTTACDRVITMNQDTVFVRYEEGFSPVRLIREVAFVLAGERPKTTDAAREMIRMELRRRRRIILVDESDRMGLKHLNALRDIHDLLKVPIVLVGEDVLQEKLRSERRLMSRVAHRIRFEPLGSEEVGVFYRLSMGQALNPDQAQKLGQAAQGDFRMMINVAIEIEKRMLASGLKGISDELVREVLNGGNGKAGA